MEILVQVIHKNRLGMRLNNLEATLPLPLYQPNYQFVSDSLPLLHASYFCLPYHLPLYCNLVNMHIVPMKIEIWDQPKPVDVEKSNKVV